MEAYVGSEAGTARGLLPKTARSLKVSIGTFRLPSRGLGLSRPPPEGSHLRAGVALRRPPGDLSTNTSAQAEALQIPKPKGPVKISRRDSAQDGDRRYRTLMQVYAE